MAKEHDAILNYSDEQLLQFVKSDDERAFDVLFNRYWRILFEAAYKRIKRPEVAEELVQDVFTSLWCNRRKLEIHQSFEAYIRTAIKYKVISYYRSSYQHHPSLDVVEEQSQLEWHVEEAFLYKELQSAIEAEIERLPEKCKEAFNLSRREQLSIKEIAAEMEISVNTVEKHIGKALKILRTNLKELMTMILFYYWPF
ncbi:MAG TPA: RNA polymerase sigma-70 factor [Cyclobacteriaceae bacterium]|nr:RNA polymerase sigma-70 factor [Cyclobacteriaceae bacterium]